MRAQAVVFIGAVVAVLALAAVIVARSRGGNAEPTRDGFNPVTVDAAAYMHPPPLAPSESPILAAALDAGFTPRELKLYQERIDPELCPKGAEIWNKLSGRPPTDPAALHVLSTCLQIGNAAWYKCLLDAKTRAEGLACNAKFLRAY